MKGEHVFWESEEKDQYLADPDALTELQAIANIEGDWSWEDEEYEIPEWDGWPTPKPDFLPFPRWDLQRMRENPEVALFLDEHPEFTSDTCINGHLKTGVNAYDRPGKGIACRKCANASGQRYYKRNAEKLRAYKLAKYYEKKEARRANPTGHTRHDQPESSDGS